MPTFLVQIKVQTDGYEKTIVTMRNADDADEAWRDAAEGEAHNELTWLCDEQCVDGCYDFVYTLCNVLEVRTEDVPTLERYLNYHNGLQWQVRD